MSLKRKAADALARCVAGGLNALSRARALKKFMLLIGRSLRVGESRVDGGAIRFHTPNEITLMRAETFYTKEPETLAWIDSFDGGTLYDIGANVGTYTVYAAMTGKAGRTIAFEPESQNFALLNRNIALNALDAKATAYNVALSDRTRLDLLHLSELNQGSANHMLGASVDPDKKPRATPFRQGSVSFSLDDFIKTFSPPFPNWIKMDVDGLEPEIVAGAKSTLADARLKGLLIEINEGLPEFLGIVETLKGLGFSAERKPHAEMFEGSPYAKYFNYVFTRRKP